MICRILLIVALAGSILHAQADPATPATSPDAPATQLVVPDGLVLTEIEGHRILSRPEDVEWIRAILQNLEPATRPTTMPADVLSRLDAERDAIVRGLTADLDLADDAPATKFIDEELRPALAKLNAFDLPLVFLVCPHQTLVEVVRGGWGEPQFHYNRLMDDVRYTPGVNVPLDGSGGPVIVPAVYKDDATDEDRAELLRRAVRGSESGTLDAISRKGALLVESQLTDFVAGQAVAAMKLSKQHEWFGVGVIGLFGGKYASLLLGIERERWMEAGTRDLPRTPVRMGSIDLLNPTDPADLREQIVPIYIETLKRKATLVLWQLARKDGDAAVTALIKRVKAKDPKIEAELTDLARTVP
jgi:hypothetical protein